MHSLCRDGSVEGMVDGTVAHIGSVHLPRQVEVDGVPAQVECLTTLPDFHMLQSVSHIHHIFRTNLKQNGVFVMGN